MKRWPGPGMCWVQMVDMEENKTLNIHHLIPLCDWGEAAEEERESLQRPGK